MSESLKYLAYYDFLRNVPSPPIDDLPEDERTCFLCLEPYKADAPKWIAGTTYHYPVTLPCGRHHVGLQCLVEWMLSKNFDNHCPLDRDEIVRNFDQRMAQKFLKREDHVMINLVVTNKNQRPTVSKPLFRRMMEKMKNSKAIAAHQGEQDRIMMLCEEYYKAFTANRANLPNNEPRINRVIIHNPGRDFAMEVEGNLELFQRADLINRLSQNMRVLIDQLQRDPNAQAQVNL